MPKAILELHDGTSFEGFSLFELDGFCRYMDIHVILLVNEARPLSFGDFSSASRDHSWRSSYVRDGDDPDHQFHPATDFSSHSSTHANLDKSMG